MAVLKRDGILDADDLKKELVSVPECGGEVWIKSLNGTERDRFEASMIEVNKKGQSKQNLENLRARMLILVLIDPDDNDLPLFTIKDVVALGKKSAAALDRVFSAAQALNGFSQKDVEDLAEGFDDAPSEDSTSG
jgi:hypothetical protein